MHEIACTICGTDAARELREKIFGADFGQNFFLALLPFLLLTTIIFKVLWGTTYRRMLIPNAADYR